MQTRCNLLTLLCYLPAAQRKCCLFRTHFKTLFTESERAGGRCAGCRPVAGRRGARRVARPPRACRGRRARRAGGGGTAGGAERRAAPKVLLLRPRRRWPGSRTWRRWPAQTCARSRTASLTRASRFSRLQFGHFRRGCACRVGRGAGGEGEFPRP